MNKGATNTAMIMAIVITSAASWVVTRVLDSPVEANNKINAVELDIRTLQAESSQYQRDIANIDAQLIKQGEKIDDLTKSVNLLLGKLGEKNLSNKAMQ